MDGAHVVGRVELADKGRIGGPPEGVDQLVAAGRLPPQLELDGTGVGILAGGGLGLQIDAGQRRLAGHKGQVDVAGGVLHHAALGQVELAQAGRSGRAQGQHHLGRTLAAAKVFGHHGEGVAALLQAHVLGKVVKALAVVHLGRRAVDLDRFQNAGLGYIAAEDLVSVVDDLGRAVRGDSHHRRQIVGTTARYRLHGQVVDGLGALGGAIVDDHQLGGVGRVGDQDLDGAVEGAADRDRALAAQEAVAVVELDGGLGRAPGFRGAQPHAHPAQRHVGPEDQGHVRAVEELGVVGVVDQRVG